MPTCRRIEPAPALVGLGRKRRDIHLSGLRAIRSNPKMNTTDMKHYRSSEWNFALKIPKCWHSMPPQCTNSPNEVMRFASKEDGTHLLIVFREIHDPRQGLQDIADAVQKVLAGHGFGNFAPGRAPIGDRTALTLDFDKPKDSGAWSCRHYFVADGTLRYTLGFGTTRKPEMFELYDRMAKSFEFQADAA